MKRQTAFVRAWTQETQPKGKPKPISKRQDEKRVMSYRKRLHSALRKIPSLVLVFDTETTVDIYQNLMIGSYLIAWVDVVGTEVRAIVLEEGLFYADDLPETDPKGFAILQEYAAKGKLFQVDGSPNTSVYRARVDWTQAVKTGRYDWNMPYRPTFDGMQLMSTSAFINDKLYEYANVCLPGEDKTATVITANGPFDFSRLAHTVSQSHPNFGRNGFSLTLLPNDGTDRDQLTEELKHHGNIQIARRGSLGNKIGIAHAKNFERTYFTDVLNLGFALTNSKHSLETLSGAFIPAQVKESLALAGLEPNKKRATEYGKVTEDFITYMRDDVLYTYLAYLGERMEVWRHPPQFDDTRAYSPAKLGKSYVDAMGLVPALTRMPDFPRDILGYAMSTSFGGRAECHVRRVPVPIWYLDFTSMHMTVNTLMKFWNFWVQDRIEYTDGTERVRQFLANPELFNQLFDQATWPDMRAIVLVEPHDDILPVRTRLGGASNTITIAHVTSETPMWWTMPDVIASTILTGRPPKVIRALDFKPAGYRLNGLKPIKLRRAVEIDPNRQDFFKVVVEQRQAIKLRLKASGHDTECTCTNDEHAGCACESCRTSESLKVTGNSCGFGMNLEFNPEIVAEQDVTVYGIGEPHTIQGDRLDKPGQWCFPPVGSLIVSGSRLMLAMLERCITDAGGTWVACDTDSMMPVVTPDGSPVKTRHGDIPALSESTARQIQERFDSLNPYDAAVAPGIHILKREHDKDPRPLYCYAISAKRYALFHLRDGAIEDLMVTDESGDIETLTDDGRKEHGLGAYMSPYNPDDESMRGKRVWVTEIWHYLICKELGIPVKEPSFFDLPVMTKVSLTTWTGYQLFRRFNAGKSWREQIKPYNFVMCPVVTQISQLAEQKHVRLVTPFERDPSKWLNAEYIDVSNPNGDTIHVTDKPQVTDDGEGVDFGVHIIRTWRSVVREFGQHPEVKYCDSNGRTCDKKTRGVLYRHHIRIGHIEYIGKESNSYSVGEQLIAIPADIGGLSYGSGRDDVRELIIPVIETIPGYRSQRPNTSGYHLKLRELGQHCGISHNAMSEYLNEPNLTTVSRTKQNNIVVPLIQLAVRHALKQIPEDSQDPSWKVLTNAYQNWQDVLLTWRGLR